MSLCFLFLLDEDTFQKGGGGGGWGWGVITFSKIFGGGRGEVVLGFTESCTACQQPFWNISAKSFKKVSVRVNY